MLSEATLAKFLVEMPKGLGINIMIERLDWNDIKRAAPRFRQCRNATEYDREARPVDHARDAQTKQCNCGIDESRRGRHSSR